MRGWIWVGWLAAALLAGWCARAEPKPGETGKKPANLALPAWKDLPGADGRKHSLDELKDKKAVLVIFFSNTCPDCAVYFDRIVAIAKEYEAKGVATILLNVSRAEEDDLQHMIRFANEKRLACQYLYDHTQQLGKKLGAAVTPEAYLFNKQRKLTYAGAVDDHWKPEKVQRRHLRIALDQTLAGGKVEVPFSAAEGCDIVYEE